MWFQTQTGRFFYFEAVVNKIGKKIASQFIRVYIYIYIKENGISVSDYLTSYLWNTLEILWINSTIDWT